MLGIDSANKSWQRHFKFTAPSQPGLMHAIARAVNVAAPNALETHQNIATKLRTQFLELVSESDRRARLHARDRTETPLVSRPIVDRNELRVVSKIDNPLAQALEVVLRAAARRIAATDESDVEFAVRHFNLTNLVIPSEVEESLNV